MVFSSVIFLFLFLPVSLICYYLVGTFLRNTMLLLMSLFFYAWGENIFILILLTSICLNYVFGIMLHLKTCRKRQKIVLCLGIFANLAILIFFKYSNFLIDILVSTLPFPGITAIEHFSTNLPLGIVFSRSRLFPTLSMSTKK